MMTMEKIMEVLRNAIVAYETELEQQDYKTEKELHAVLLNEFGLTEAEYNYVFELQKHKRDDEKRQMELKNTIKQECKYREKLNGNGFYNYMHLQECTGSPKNGLYQLILNGEELWYGTLAEINAVVKTMIIREKRGN